MTLTRRATAEPSFYEELTAAVNDFRDNGYDSELRLRAWLGRLRDAARREMVPEAEAQERIADALRGVYRRMIEGGGLLRDAPSVAVGRFTLERVRSELRAELDRAILASANLIVLNRERAMAETLQRFSGWATSIPLGGTEVVDRREVKRRVGMRLGSMNYIDRRLYTDQSHKLSANLSRIIAHGSGAIAGEWRQHYTRFPREEHRKRNGKIYLIRGSWAHLAGLVKPGPGGYTDEITQPAEEVSCLPAKSKIEFADGVEVAYRRWYCGELTELVMSSGKTFRATPNHPVLTPNGWIAVGLLKEGDKIIEILDKSIRSSRSEIDEDKEITTIADIFQTIERFSLLHVPTKGCREQFHGDGTDSDIDVIFATRPLSFGRQINILQTRKKFKLAYSFYSSFSLSDLCKKLFGSFTTTSCFVSRISHSFALLWCRVGPSIEHLLRSYFAQPIVSIFGKIFSVDFVFSDVSSDGSFRNATQRDTSASQTVVCIIDTKLCINDSCTKAGLVQSFNNICRYCHQRWITFGVSFNISFADSLFGFFAVRSLWSFTKNIVRRSFSNRTIPDSLGSPPPLSSDVFVVVLIVKTSTSSFSGHVYNLQTKLGWYVTEGIITHNCRCTYKYFFTLSQLPANMLTEKGRTELDRVRAEIGRLAA